MSSKVVVIISTAEVAKARTGAMYAVNAVKYGWLDEVKLFFFGPSEKLLLTDETLRQYADDFREFVGPPIACKFIADREGLSDQVAALGLQVDYVGKAISDLIGAGYTPMVW